MPTEAEIKRQKQKDAREIRVFLSSTFKDMDEERNYLLKQVFPEIRQVCAKRQVAFTEIDLRWGVTEEAVQSGATVEICLKEIERCRDFPPFFIGFLGERYGWIPTNIQLKQYWERQAKNNDKETAALAEKIKKAVEQEISVTELEMQLAVLAPDASLDTKAHSDNALFLLRDQSLTKKFYEKTRSEKSETVKTDFHDAADGKLDELKERIRESGFLGLDNYKSVKDFGEHIKQHLLKAINEIFPEDQQVDEWEQLDRAHRVFANHRRENFLPRVEVREQILDAIRERVEKPYLGPVVLTGPSGQGKSALMADLAKHLKENQPEFELVLEHYVGADGGTTLSGWVGRMQHALEVQVGDINDPKLKTLGDWASRAAQKIRQEKNKPQLKLVCVVDALDQLEDTSDLKRLLSEETGEHLIVITSVADGTDARAWVEEHIEGQIDVPPLDTGARRKMVTETFKRFRKELESDQVERLASAEQCGSPLFLKLALEDLRLNARHESMAEKVSTVLDAPDAKSLFLNNFLRDEDYNRDQQPDMAVEFMALLSASYNGLSDQELADLLAMESDPKQENGQPRIPQQYISQLINNFSPFLLNRHGRIAPMHRMFGETALTYCNQTLIREKLYEFFKINEANSSNAKSYVETAHQAVSLFEVNPNKYQPWVLNSITMQEASLMILRFLAGAAPTGFERAEEVFHKAISCLDEETFKIFSTHWSKEFTEKKEEMNSVPHYFRWKEAFWYRNSLDDRLVCLAQAFMKITPNIPKEIKNFKYPGYVNIFEMIPDAKTLYGLETLFGDWDGRILLLTFDAANAENVYQIIKSEGVKGWRYDKKLPTNKNLLKLLETTNVGKLFGPYTANMLKSIVDSPSPVIERELNSYFEFVLGWVISEMQNLEVIITLGKQPYEFVQNIANQSPEGDGLQLSHYWKDFVLMRKPQKVNLFGRDVFVGATSNPGAWGIRNRAKANGIYGPEEPKEGLKLMQEDFKKIIELALST